MVKNWQEEANCKSSETALFFPVDGEKYGDRKRREAKAKAVCGGCVVVDDCFLAGLEEDSGIWGGLNERERAQRMAPSVVRRGVSVVAKPVPVVVPTRVEQPSEGHWTVIEQASNCELWQRFTDRTWHGSEWVSVKDGAQVQVYETLESAYIGFNAMLG